ncbi:hypothetical protein O181_022957 [Austropuccinia psidii MF-1]|uniref:Uncharacterized protein n=1 Tax=Austropuccinia psidii MF-1 TaxID=1389203 RepID=A0A9Q3CIL3_9BASI|nr:hypothetical protein [Austropuccinia psidii MF-1]
MSKEDQVILTSYVNLLPVIKTLFKIKYLWIPYAQSFSTASTGFYIGLVLRSSPFKVGRTVTTMCNHHPMGAYDNSSLNQIYGQLAISSVLWPIRPFVVLYGFWAICTSSGHILKPLALLANSPPHQPPGQYPCFGPGGSFSPRGLWILYQSPGSLAQHL